MACYLYGYILREIPRFLNLFNRDEREDETREVNLS